MYLVELRPGKEELYRTSDDLALAIRDGDVDARSRIYHRSTAKWISITLHPQFKAIVAGQKDDLRPARKGWGLIPAGLSRQTDDPALIEEMTENGNRLERWKRPLGLGLASVLLVLGIQLAFSGPRPPWSGRGQPALAWNGETERITRTESVSPIEHEGTELASLASSTTVWPVNSEPISDTVIVPVRRATPVLPRAPRLRPKALSAALVPEDITPKAVEANSVEGLLGRYEHASNGARVKLETGMRVARLSRLFASSRLTPGGGVTDTRLSLAGAVNFMRVFRRQQAVIDAAYKDTVTVLAKRHRWTPQEIRQWNSRPQRKEAPTLELLSGSLIASIDSMLGVLGAQAGAYKLSGTGIAFEDAKAREAYGALRRQIQEQIDSAIAAGGATSPGPTSLLLQAIGTSTLPRET